MDERALVVHGSIVEIEGQGVIEGRTKNRRTRTIAIDDRTLEIVWAQIRSIDMRSTEAGVALVDDPYLFSDALDGAAPWRPGAVSLFFRRLRERVDLDHLSFHSLRKFMDTHGEELGVSRSQVALRAGHDPAVDARHAPDSAQPVPEHERLQFPSGIFGCSAWAFTCGTHEADRRVTALALCAALTAPAVRAFAGYERVLCENATDVLIGRRCGYTELRMSDRKATCWVHVVRSAMRLHAQ